MSKIIHYPFNEERGSTYTYEECLRADIDISELENIEIEKGYVGNGMKFTGSDYSQIITKIPLDFNYFTQLCFYKINGIEGELNTVHVLCEFDNEIGIDKTILLRSGTWYHIAVAVDMTKSIDIYVNGILAQSYDIDTDWKAFTALGIQSEQTQENVNIDEYIIYDTYLTENQIYTIMANDTEIIYTIDGTRFKDYDVYVEQSDGVIDILKLKEQASQDWKDEHGIVVDTTSQRLQQREIKLKCFMIATGRADLTLKMIQFTNLFRKAGTRRLMIQLSDTTVLVYEVILSGSSAVEKRWASETQVAEFTLTLTEPEPVKKVIKFDTDAIGSTQASITFTSTNLINIYWGNGSSTKDISGTAQTKTKEYSAEGIFYIIVTGIIDEITNFNTNGEVVWSQIS